MSETTTASSEGASTEPEKPVQVVDNVKFPPFPDPTDCDFEDDIPEEEINYYKNKFIDLNAIKSQRLHCTACDRHLGSSARNDSRMRSHPMLRTLVCHTCHSFYNSGEFEKGDDGSELYCRWCGQGGQVYCCSDCPHVFCAKCIKRNLGVPKIKEIENTDDWKCFKCNPRCLWDIRAVCWALLRYCDLKNKITYQTEDPVLKEAYQKDCAQDYTECCKNKGRRKEKLESAKKKEKDAAENLAKKIISKIPSTIQVKKFASINLDESPSQEKKATKRSASPKFKPFVMKNPIAIASCPKILNPTSIPPLNKKMKMPNPPLLNSIRLVGDRKQVSTYTRIRPKPPMPIPIINSHFNGFNNTGAYNNVNNMTANDNINLSLESLTQGLDMAAVAAMSNNHQNDNVVCTPDFPLEPLCEVTEDNDDDVQCITPGPVAAPKVPPLVPRSATVPDLSSDNIIQMTDNDVTVNALTGGLKFRVDPQTLSSNKMYRLPDGRIFAINANPNMPGGYSATIVAVTEATNKTAPKGATFAAKLSAIPPALVTPSPKSHINRKSIFQTPTSKTSSKETKGIDTQSRQCDLNVPVEWYRYNLVDAVDALEYSLSRLHKLKKENTTMYLRTRTIGEMRSLHRSLERLLNTSSTRFSEIRENLNKEMKQYIMRKSGGDISEDDDDDVEILPDLEENDDPIFIDENSMESISCNESQEVDLTEAASSEHNDSGENKNVEDSFSKVDAGSEIQDSFVKTNTDPDVEDHFAKIETDPLTIMEQGMESDNTNEVSSNNTTSEFATAVEFADKKNVEKQTDSDDVNKKNEDEDTQGDKEDNAATCRTSTRITCNETIIDKTNGEIQESVDKQEANINKEVKNEKAVDNEKSILNDKADNEDEKIQDTEMSEEMIETLLKDDNLGDEVDNASNSNCLDIPELEET